MSSSKLSNWQEHPQLNILRAELEFLLAQKNSRVIFLKGVWGCGKTTLVTKILESSKHSYISLYGVSNIDEIKSQLVLTWLTEHAPKNDEVKNDGWIAKIWKMSKQQVKGLMDKVPILVNFGKSWTAKRYSYALPVGFYALLEKNELEIVVFDDIERRDKNLELNNFLGLVSYMAENSDVKILMVGNEEKILSETDDRVSAFSGLEKTVDSSLMLSPPVNWLATIAAGETHMPEEVVPAIEKFCFETNTQNVRLLKRACRMLDRTLQVLVDNSLIGHCNVGELVSFYLILTFSKHENDFELSWQELPQYLQGSLIASLPDEDIETLGRVERIARKLNLPDIAFYEEMLRHVETGLLDQPALISRIQELVSKEVDLRSIESSEHWVKIWSLYSSSFSENQDQIRTAMEEFLSKDSDLLTVKTFGRLKDFADTLDFDVSEYRLEAHKRSIQMVDQEELPTLLNTYKDEPELLNEIQLRLDECVESSDINEILNNARKSHGWSLMDTWIIENLTVDEIKEWLLLPDERKVYLIRAARNIDKSGKFDKAIREIAKDSSLSRMRANQIYRIDLDADEEIS